MKVAILKCGALTENQLAAVLRGVARSDAWKAEKATEIDCSKIAAAFATAVGNGLKRPKMTIDGIRFSLAPATGRNAGSIYVKARAGDAYLGKITGTAFFPARETTPEQVATVVAIAADPGARAKAYGLNVGSCSCCGRELTDPVSVSMGIGPICAGNYGF